MAPKSAWVSNFLFAAGWTSFVLISGGCDPSAQVAEIAQKGRDLLAGISGTPRPKASPAVNERDYQFSSENAKKAKIHAELLHEMYQVVLMREPESRAEFGSLVDTLNQGASFEGIYNGFTHSSNFRKLEVANPGASYEAVKIFSEELAVFEKDLPKATEFDASAARPLAMVMTAPEAETAPEFQAQDVRSETAEGVSLVEFGKSAKKNPAAGDKASAASPAEKYARLFSTASIYTLKRVLGDEALKVVAAKKASRENLSKWYAKWVISLVARNVDFGLPLRNKADEPFHQQWAMSASVDQLQWEVLNRLHRLLNEAYKKKP